MELPIGPTYMEINLDTIASNTNNIKRLIGNKELMAVVKGNAYTHDMIEVSKTVLKNGASRLGVGRLEEGIYLRKAGITAPILNMCLNMEGQEREIVKYDIVQTVCDLDTVHRLSCEAAKMNKSAKIHVKIDTGMGRIGIFPEDVSNFISEVSTMQNIELEGVYTHFATPHDKEFMSYQLKLFSSVLKRLNQEGYSIPLKHCASSEAFVAMPDTWKKFDMVRIGDLVYGVYNSEEEKDKIKVNFAQTFKTTIVFLKKLGPNTSIGYDRTYITDKDTIIATLPAGYNDGYTKLYSNNGIVLVRGKKAPVVGRVCADQMMIDVTNIPDAKVGDEVVLWGRQGNETVLPVYDYIFMGDKQRVPKVFIKNNKPWKVKSIFGEKVF